MRTVRVESRHFTAMFQTDGAVCSAEAPLSFMLGWSDAKVRGVVKKNRWRATIVAGATADDVRRVLDVESSEPVRKDSDYQPLVFTCLVCGREACFGYGVALREGKIGTWYCTAHRPRGERHGEAQG